MARQTAAQEINSFSKGIITEASPLTFPDNASINETNLTIERDGSRRRRYGMNLEPNYQVHGSGQSINNNLAYSSFAWKSPGGYTEYEFVVVQIGNRINIFNSTTRPISNSLIYTTPLEVDVSKALSFTAVDGLLLIASNTSNILILDWNGANITLSSGRLKIRDLFGVEDIVNGVNLLEGTNVALRPSVLTYAHTYNLRNQTYAIPRYYFDSNTLKDPIQSFVDVQVTYGRPTTYPSNADDVVTYLYADPNFSNDRNSRRYMVTDAVNNPLGTNRASLGYFIIDALDRGNSRMEEVLKLNAQYPYLNHPVVGLPLDSTPGGASVIASFAGRAWFAGFSSKVINGDSESPRMGSYILFSQLVKSPSDVFKCYQEGDPTSSEAPDLVDTDGGFIRLDGAHNIQKMVNIGDSLMVIAENGVWRISGGSGYGFKATDYLSSKVTEHGCISPDAVVLVDNTIMYWTEDGIYHVAPNQYGEWVATSITANTIKGLYDGIPYLVKSKAQGLFDSYQRKVRWLYNGDIASGAEAVELILDVNLGAFYTSTIKQLDGSFPKPISLVKVPPFTIGNEDATVITNTSDTVVDSAANIVTVKRENQISSTSEIMYLTAVDSSAGVLNYSFSYYYDTSFKDWNFDGNGVDANAFLITGWSGFGDFQRYKQIPYLTIYSIKTETGFTANYEPVNSSSIKVQTQWSWTNSESSGKWSPYFQAYRHNRLWMPEDSNSDFDNGNYVVKTKNKIRGRGNVISLKFETEPDKDFHLLGWSYIVNVNGAP